LINKGKKVLLLKKNHWVGGQIRTFEEDGFVFESEPNTGSVFNLDKSVGELANQQLGKSFVNYAIDNQWKVSFSIIQGEEILSTILMIYCSVFIFI
jgi:phytoene dehydrogenase-like protein